MSQALASPANCCDPCSDQVTTQIPGAQGEPGADGTNGSDGISAFSDLTAAYTQPGVNASSDAEVANSDWATVGQIIFLEGGGYYEVIAIPDSTTITIENLGYDANSAPTTVIAIGSHIGPAGEKGADGVGGGGDMLYADNLNAMGSNDTTLSNLDATAAGKGFFRMTSPSAVTFPRINMDNTVTARTAANLRTDLTLVPGTDIQVYDADLTAIAALVSAADRVPYATGAGTWALFTATSVGRSLVAQATTALMLTALGKVLPRHGMLAKLTAVAMDATADHAMGIVATRFRITGAIVEAATGTLLTGPCTGGLFKTAGGLNPIAADQTLAACVAPTNFASLTLGGIGLTDLFIADLIFRVGTPSTAGITANVWVFGEDLS